jgi:PadR family transcriptional regulator, regulatory protein PadR
MGELLTMAKQVSDKDNSAEEDTGVNGIEQPVEETVKATRSTRKKATAARPKDVEDEGDDANDEVGVAPKTFLTPYMLLMLRDSFMHGYAIWERLMVMGIPGLNESDRATIYRTLRQLEREGKVKSEWDTNTEGPARRVYTLTDAGEAVLKLWATGLDQYRQSLDFFFKLYAGSPWTNPFGFGLPPKDKDKK